MRADERYGKHEKHTGREEEGTYGSLYREAVKELREADIEDASTDARLLLAFVSGLDTAHLYAAMAEEMSPSGRERYCELVRRRKAHVPLQKLTGTADFCGIPFSVRGDVLIPRQDTELLAERAIGKVREMGNRREGPVRVLDLGTGSGCLAIAMKVYCPEAEVTASDISPAALDAARENAQNVGVKVRYVKSSLFQDLPEVYSVIVSNPPYIRTSEIPALQEEVRLHEPRLALDGGEDGLSFYREIAREAGRHLEEGGWLCLEIGCTQGDEVSELLREAGFLDVSLERDLSGKDRVVLARRREARDV